MKTDNRNSLIHLVVNLAWPKLIFSSVDFCMNSINKICASPAVQWLWCQYMAFTVSINQQHFWICRALVCHCGGLLCLVVTKSLHFFQTKFKIDNNRLGKWNNYCMAPTSKPTNTIVVLVLLEKLIWFFLFVLICSYSIWLSLWLIKSNYTSQRQFCIWSIDES